jgi:hypothetical protein
MDEDMAEDDWGDDAVLQWDHTADEPIPVDSASSVAPEDAGVSEREDDWGRNAEMEWAWSPSAESVALSGEDLRCDEEPEEGLEVDEQPASQPAMEETKEQLLVRGMPDYDQWELKGLQVCVPRLVGSQY